MNPLLHHQSSGKRHVESAPVCRATCRAVHGTGAASPLLCPAHRRGLHRWRTAGGSGAVNHRVLSVALFSVFVVTTIARHLTGRAPGPEKGRQPPRPAGSASLHRGLSGPGQPRDGRADHERGPAGCSALQIPGNLALNKLGPRRWLGLLTIARGVVAMLTSLVQGEQSLVVVRIALGAVEAGLLPGTFMYLTIWFPPRMRGRITAVVCLPFYAILGTPLSAYVIQYADGMGGLAERRWMLLLEGCRRTRPGCAGDGGRARAGPKSRTLPEPVAVAARFPPRCCWRPLRRTPPPESFQCHHGRPGAVRSCGPHRVRSEPLSHGSVAQLDTGTVFRPAARCSVSQYSSASSGRAAPRMLTAPQPSAR
ncbi:Putative tartrate transporter [Streptomyces malaysiensis subsp. malaysiensis]|nr:Putative tartrate transporter [Streptomyces sp. M56]